MTYAPSRIEISCPFASADGLYHLRYPQGNAPSLAGAALDATAGAGTLLSGGSITPSSTAGYYKFVTGDWYELSQYQQNEDSNGSILPAFEAALTAYKATNAKLVGVQWGFCWSQVEAGQATNQNSVAQAQQGTGQYAFFKQISRCFNYQQNMVPGSCMALAFSLNFGPTSGYGSVSYGMPNYVLNCGGSLTVPDYFGAPTSQTYMLAQQANGQYGCLPYYWSAGTSWSWSVYSSSSTYTQGQNVRQSSTSNNYYQATTAVPAGTPLSNGTYWKQIEYSWAMPNLCDPGVARVVANFLQALSCHQLQDFDAYSASTVYHQYEGVVYNGNHYVCQQTTTAGTQPGNSAYWAQVSKPSYVGQTLDQCGLFQYLTSNDEVSMPLDGPAAIAYTSTDPNTGNAPTAANWWRGYRTWCRAATGADHPGLGFPSTRIGTCLSNGFYGMTSTASTQDWDPVIQSLFDPVLGIRGLVFSDSDTLPKNLNLAAAGPAMQAFRGKAPVYSAWSAITAYTVKYDTLVTHNGVNYNCIVANTGQEPSATSTYWSSNNANVSQNPDYSTVAGFWAQFQPEDYSMGMISGDGSGENAQTCYDMAHTAYFGNATDRAWSYQDNNFGYGAAWENTYYQALVNGKGLTPAVPIQTSWPLNPNLPTNLFSQPSGLAVVVSAAHQVTLTWNTQNGVSYIIYQDGARIGTAGPFTAPTLSTFTKSGIASGMHAYTVAMTNTNGTGSPCAAVNIAVP